MSMPGPSLSLLHTRDGDRATLAVAGEIDLATAGQLEDRLYALADEGCRYIVVDLSEVRFCDARGLSALVAGHWRVRDNSSDGWLRLAAVRPPMAKLLKITELSDLFGVYATAAEAAETEAAPTDRGHFGSSRPERGPVTAYPAQARRDRPPPVAQ